MNRSVVIHRSTAWCRSHPATSRCTAGSVLRRNVGRGGNRVASATLPLVTASFPQLQPDQKAVGQHHRDRMPMKPRPQAALVLVPAQLPLLGRAENRVPDLLILERQVANGRIEVAMPERALHAENIAIEPQPHFQGKDFS